MCSAYKKITGRGKAGAFSSKVNLCTEHLKASEHLQIDLLAVDIGNSRIHSGLFRQGKLVSSWYHNLSQATESIKQAMTVADKHLIVLSSVVPSVDNLFREQCKCAVQDLLEINPDSQHLIKEAYPAIGTDRLANISAAWKLWGGALPVAVVDLGTATTLTAVTANGRFAGGFISLGLSGTISGIIQQAAQLPKVDLANLPTELPGLAFNTSPSITSGAILSQLGGIESWIKQAKKELGKSLIIVATGGWSEPIAKLTDIFDHVDPDLTLKGIYFIAAEALLKHPF